MNLRQKYKNAKKAIERLNQMRRPYYPYLKREEREIHKYTAEYFIPFCDDIPEEHIRKVMSQKFADAVMDNMQMEAFEIHDCYGHHCVFWATIMLVDLNMGRKQSEKRGTIQEGTGDHCTA